MVIPNQPVRRDSLVSATLPLFLSLALSLGLMAPAHANNPEPASGRVIMAHGDVSALRTERNDSSQTIPLRRRSPVFQQDTLITGANSKAQVRFKDGGLVALKPSSRLVVSRYETSSKGPDVVMELIEGGFRTLTGKLGKQGPDAYQVNTPVGTIGIRGTLYSALLHKGQLFLGTWQGSILVETHHGLYPLGTGADFNFAAISTAGFTGLLQPPIQLQPAGIIPLSAQISDDSSNDQGDSSNDQGGSSDNSDDDAENSNEEGVVLTPLEREENTDNLSTFQSNGQLNDDSSIVPTSDLVSPDTRLSAEEYNAFITSNRLGAIINADQFRAGTIIDKAGQEPVLVAVNEEASLDIVRFNGTSQFREQPSSSLDIEWGIWTGTNLTPIQIYPERNSDQHTDFIGQSLWITGTPTRSVDLSGLTGTVQFSATDAIGFNQDGIGLSTASGSFNLNLSSGEVTDGMLETTFGHVGFDNLEADTWTLGFEGSIRSGDRNTAQVDINLDTGSHNDVDINLDDSHFEGILVGEQAEGFVGGFYLIDNRNQTATGAVLMEQL